MNIFFVRKDDRVQTRPPARSCRGITRATMQGLHMSAVTRPEGQGKIIEAGGEA